MKTPTLQQTVSQARGAVTTVNRALQDGYLPEAVRIAIQDLAGRLAVVVQYLDDQAADDQQDSTP